MFYQIITGKYPIKKKEVGIMRTQEDVIKVMEEMQLHGCL
jgi:hypothetical protein